MGWDRYLPSMAVEAPHTHWQRVRTKFGTCRLVYFTDGSVVLCLPCSSRFFVNSSVPANVTGCTLLLIDVSSEENTVVRQVCMVRLWS